MVIVTKPQTARSKEASLQIIASKITGAPLRDIPKSEDAILAFIADNWPTNDEPVEKAPAKTKKSKKEGND